MSAENLGEIKSAGWTEVNRAVFFVFFRFVSCKRLFPAEKHLYK